MPRVRLCDHEVEEEDVEYSEDESESGSDDDAVNNEEVVPSSATEQTTSNLLQTFKRGDTNQLHGEDRIPLQCVLCKLLVHGEGGHFVQHQDTEKEDGMIATLFVQLLSTHEGGDLVVYQGDMEYRCDYGKADGTAAFANYSAVHHADAVHALEEVKNGYRAVLVYSVCLPPKMRYLERKQDGSDVETMAEAMKHVKEPFTLFFRHECADKSITERGNDTLKASTILELLEETHDVSLVRSFFDRLLGKC